MIAKRYLPESANGKKPPILSCDAATLGGRPADHKCGWQKMLSNCIRFHTVRTILRGRVRGCGMFRDMQSSSNQRPFHIYGTRDRKTSFVATDFLRSNDRLAALMPTALRVGNLQRDVKAILPPMYAGCDVLSFQEATLTLAVPSSAVAAKLKQQVPKLQAGLQKKGWQVDNVRIKIQMRPNVPVREEPKPSTLTLPLMAVEAFEQLGETLPETQQNAALIAAIRRLAERRKK